MGKGAVIFRPECICDNFLSWKFLDSPTDEWTDKYASENNNLDIYHVHQSMGYGKNLGHDFFGL